MNVTTSRCELVPASIEEKPIIDNLSRLYAYEMSGFMGEDPYWACPDTGMYDTAEDLKSYWVDSERHPYLIWAHDELAGYALISQHGSSEDIDYRMEHFFIIRRFQNQGIGREVAHQCFERFSGCWEIPIPEGNHEGRKFWKNVVNNYTNSHFSEVEGSMHCPQPQPAFILSFES